MRRSVNFNVDASGRVDKRVPQYGGVRGEHNATEIVFTMSATAPYQEGDLVRLRFTGGDGAVLSSDLVDAPIVQDGRMLVSYSLPSVLTQSGGQLGVRVVFSCMDEDGRENETFMTDEAVLYFEDSASENGTPFWTGVSEMLKRTTESVDAAVSARDAAVAAKSEAQSSADKAEEFKGAAVDAAVDATSAEKNAQLYASAALSHRDDAEAAMTSARAAASTANGSARIADEAKTKALKAQSDAVLAASKAEAAKEQIVQEVDRIDQLATGLSDTNKKMGVLAESMLSKKGHAPNKYLGSDENGNVVEKDAPEGGDTSATDEQVQNAVDDYLERHPVKDGVSVGVSNVTESTESGGENVVVFSDGKSVTVRNGKDGDPYTLTDADKVEIADEVLEYIGSSDIPTYWQPHLTEKIAAVKAKQDEGGKDAFSFVVMTDMHFPTNLGERSPLLAKHIMDACAIPYAMCLGDTQTRGCHATKDLLLEENSDVDKMLSPLLGRLLRTEGNHDGSYGFYDKDGDGGYKNTHANGEQKAPADRETYVYNLTPNELYGAVYRSNGLIGGVRLDESGTGFYVDDTVAKVRYIVLNTQKNDYALQENGTQLYPKMWLMRFGQSQFDMLIDALETIPSEDWAVVVAGHCPLWQELGDAAVMKGVLGAYQAKDRYAGEYVGTAEGGAAYTNLADPLPDNATDKSKWVNDHRIASSGVSAQNGKTVSNIIPVSPGDVVRVKGITFDSAADRLMLTHKNASAGAYVGGGAEYYSVSIGGNSTFWEYTLRGDVHEFKRIDTNSTYTHVRFAFTTPDNPSDVIITVNEEIIEAAHGYDYVNVSCDFQEAKGTLVGYFAGHNHVDAVNTQYGQTVDAAHAFPCITVRCDAAEENDAALKAERVVNTVTEQSFDVVTVNKATRTISATKIGAGDDRTIHY